MHFLETLFDDFNWRLWLVAAVSAVCLTAVFWLGGLFEHEFLGQSNTNKQTHIPMPHYTAEQVIAKQLQLMLDSPAVDKTQKAAYVLNFAQKPQKLRSKLLADSHDILFRFRKFMFAESRFNTHKGCQEVVFIDHVDSLQVFRFELVKVTQGAFDNCWLIADVVHLPKK
ncbi:MAG: hypothetical protein EAZ67_04360 [Cytophagales bacterium]|nr:MAG: hypothetical protein EAZ67_04360 [Cytophagales bacterium]